MAIERNFLSLVERLRGVYSIPVNDGAGPLNGQEIVTRQFTGLPPIHGEAADAIEQLMELCCELWRARRNAYGPAGERLMLDEHPWLAGPAPSRR